ncbi:hypothetical protein CALVIDRAFT_218839 [Calocera viscosa TUFC12733]|uniref:Uncharacterized protein n=1 Tax=Calocera viscosa (strain TUFC12733) TaxID=1330018 RepID=A0A167RIV9_CALVF|nr:hypothetical protein CALVIDRAFT_218839 [Calocera viscosa TUFC12733]
MIRRRPPVGVSLLPLPDGPRGEPEKHKARRVSEYCACQNPPRDFAPPIPVFQKPESLTAVMATVSPRVPCPCKQACSCQSASAPRREAGVGASRVALAR